MNEADTLAAEAKSLPRPDLRIKIAGKEVKMTYGLLMDLQRLLPDATQAMALIMADPSTQDYVMRRVMTDKKGTITEEAELASAASLEDLEPEDMERILDWVVQHILHFFAQRAGNLAAVGQKFKTALPNLFTAGSENSPSTTPSAGPSEPQKTD